MLILEIIVGVFGGLILFWFVYRRTREREEWRRTEKIKLESDIAAVKNYKDDLELLRGVQFNNYLEVFQGRLLTLEDDKTITFQDAGFIELNIFFEHSNKLLDEILAEENEAIVQRGCDDALAVKLNTALGEFITKSRSVLQSYALQKFEEKVLEIANNNS